jgi:hypothetical protein
MPRPSPEDISSWFQDFLSNVRNNPTARRAWRRLRVADLAEAAMYHLWKYGHSDSQFLKVRKDAGRVAREVRDTIRALRIAKSDQEPKRAKDALIFYRRALEHLMKLDQPLHWPFLWEAEAPLAMHIELSRREGFQPLQLLEGHFKFLASTGGPLRREVWLRKLQELAMTSEVNLGLKSLVALAECAAPSLPIDCSRASRTFKRWAYRFPNLLVK